jgi:protein-L-isoaspartate(D-aspartate) O-methyltransferase
MVWSIERWERPAPRARLHLAGDGTTKVKLVVGDNSDGVPARAPYDGIGILVFAAFPHVPPPLIAQPGEVGRLVQPIGRGGDEDIVLFAKRNEALHRVAGVAGARFVSLVGRYGFRA